jgi:hypothetical protein
MKTNSMKVLAIACGAALALVSGVSMAESQYGYNSAGTGQVTAQATVKLSVTVPKLILLKVGSSDTGTGTAVQDTLSWTATISIPGVPTTPTTGNNTGVNWSGAVPTVTAGTNPGAVSVSAWTNGTGATINCAAPTWTPATGGPANTDFGVTATGTLPHPGATLGACTSTAIPSNSLATGTWAYALTGTPANWTAGSYTASVLYTATAP